MATEQMLNRGSLLDVFLFRLPMELACPRCLYQCNVSSLAKKFIGCQPQQRSCME